MELTKKQLYRKEYYLKNKEKALEQSSNRYLAKKEELLQYQREYRKTNRVLVTTKMKQKRSLRLRWAVKELGNQCAHCGVRYPDCVYDFHHTDKTEKEFTIGENMLVSWDRFQKEIQKCLLLCANCHRQVHGSYKIADE